jgi:transcriptional regulator with XRE-family HTH domain
MSNVLYVHVLDADPQAVQRHGMAHDIPALLAKMMEVLPGNQTQLAERLSERGRNGLKVTQPQVSRWMKGQQPERPSYDRIVSVARAMHVLTDMRSEDVAAALPAHQRKAVKLRGYVGAGSEAHFYAVADDDFEEVAAPDNAGDKTIALQIRGKSWGPAMDTWLVFYDDVRSPVTPDLLGPPCVVGLADDRILLKVIKSNGRGGFDLHSNSSTEDVIKDANIEWAAKVTSMRPR